MSVETSFVFDHESSKKLLTKLDFEYFLKQNIEEEKYPQEDIQKIYTAHDQTLKTLKEKANQNKHQFNYYAEGQVRKCFTGGFIPTIFELNENRGHRILNFQEAGEVWAYFEFWQNYYKKKITREKIWNVIIKSGSLLAILLSILKVYELLFLK